MAFVASVASVAASTFAGASVVDRDLIAADDSTEDSVEANVPAGAWRRTGASASAFCSAAERKIGALLFVVIVSPCCACGPARRSHQPAPARRGGLFLLVRRTAPRAPAPARAHSGARPRLRHARLRPRPGLRPCARAGPSPGPR